MLMALALLAAPAHAGKNDDQARIEALEARVQALEAEVDALDSLKDRVDRLANAPARPSGPPPIDQEAEREAADLLKQANEAYTSMEYDRTREILDQIDRQYPDTRAQRAATRIRDELEVIGIDAGEINAAKWFQGDAAMDSGKVTMIVFWEVWCPHCKREVPKLQSTYEKFRAEGLNLVGMTKMTRSITEEQVTSFIEENGVSYPIGLEEGQDLSQRFNVKGIPASVVVKDGSVVWRGHPARITDDMINGWLDN